MEERVDMTGISELLIQMGGVLLTEQSLASLLELMAVLVHRTVPSAVGVSITLDRHGAFYTSNATEGAARALDQVQYASGDGPCLTALREGRQLEALLAEHRAEWPAFVEAAEERGIRSVLSTPLVAVDRSFGAMNVYSQTTEAFRDADKSTLTLIARQAGIVLANAVAIANAEELNTQLQEALAARQLIGDAKAILMERDGCGPDEAFEILRRVSQRTNRKVRDIAAEVVGGGAAPDRPQE